MASNYLDELNEIQRNAATQIDGPVLVIAGPGSGKTRVLTYRIAHLIHSGVPARNILTLTFTNKAAREMKERIQKVVGSAANEIWAGTFHSIFARILRAEAEKIGFPSDFSIYDTSDAKSVLTEIVKNQGLDPKVYTPGVLYNRISIAKNNLISPARYAQDAERLVDDRNAKVPYIYQIYDLYTQKCQRAGAMDFDDLLYQMHELLSRNPDDVVEKYRERFRYVLVDEFQDTNQLQYAIIQRLVHYPGSPKNICVVGDDAQSIYAFRGATIQNILDFEKDYPELKVYKLEQNYRSTQPIVQAANELIANNRRQLKKTIFSQKGEGDPIKVVRAATDEEEARIVVQTILEQRARFQLSYDDVAILYRTNAQSRVLEEFLKNFRIPYKVYGGLSFYERKEVKDALAYLRVVVNPKDEEALRRIINYPTRGIGQTTVDEIFATAEREKLAVWEVLKKAYEYNLAPRALPYIKNFVHMIELFRTRLPHDNAYDLAGYVLRMSTLLDTLKEDKTAEGKERLDNAIELLDGIKSFVENDELSARDTSIPDKSLTSYLQNVILLTDLSTNPEDTAQVKLMSVHSAKGLEFKSVFVVGMEENIFPSGMALKSKDARAALDEERRLFYVAITRAEQLLTLTYSTSRYRFGKMEYNTNSRFLDEIKDSCQTNFKGVSPNSSLVRSIQRERGQQSVQRTNHNIKPAAPDRIGAGAKVLHERFGEGKVISVEGLGDGRIATVLFADPIGEKRIMLKFAKLELI